MEKFIENQKIPKWMSFIFLVLTIYMAYLLIKNYETSAFIGILVGTLISLLILLLFLIANLITEIDSEGIRIKYIPFHFKYLNYNWNEIESCKIRKYSSISEFGGWGIRYGFRKIKSYTVKGNQGIQLVLKNGKDILIGTQKRKEIEKLIGEYLR